MRYIFGYRDGIPLIFVSETPENLIYPPPVRRRRRRPSEKFERPSKIHPEKPPWNLSRCFICHKVATSCQCSRYLYEGRIAIPSARPNLEQYDRGEFASNINCIQSLIDRDAMIEEEEETEWA